jgi:hypothetical protein
MYLQCGLKIGGNNHWEYSQGQVAVSPIPIREHGPWVERRTGKELLIFPSSNYDMDRFKNQWVEIFAVGVDCAVKSWLWNLNIYHLIR